MSGLPEGAKTSSFALASENEIVDSISKNKFSQTKTGEEHIIKSNRKLYYQSFQTSTKKYN